MERARAGYILALLTALYTLSFVERQILGLLVDPIRADLGLGDTAVSLLMGFAFAAVYSVAGVPVARLIDAHPRRVMLGLSLLLRGAASVFSALSTGLFPFAAFRMLSGLGLSALSPAAYSLIADDYPKERRAWAIGIYNIGAYAGSGIAFVVGGLLTGLASRRAHWDLPLLGSLRPWQFTLVLVALPQLLLVPLCWTIAEPARRQLATSADAATGGLSHWLGKNRRPWLLHHFGFGLIVLGAYAMGGWTPAFFQRTYGWTTSKSGIVVGIVSLLAGPAGILTAGRISDRLSQKGVADAPLRVTLWLAGGSVLALPCMCLAPNGHIAAGALAVLALLFSGCASLGHTALQQMVPHEMRARAAGVFLLVLVLVGVGIGPTAVAAVTEFVFRRDASLRYSLLLVNGVAWIAGAVLLQACRRPYAAVVRELSLLKLN